MTTANPSRIKFSKRTIDALTYAGTQDEVWDTDIAGFGVRLNASSKAFFVKSRLNGKLKTVPIGKYGVWTVDAARDRAREILVDFSKGIDPTYVPDAAPTEKQVTVKEVIDRFLEEYSKPNKKSYATDKQRLNYHGAPLFDKPIDSIDSPTLVALHRKITVSGSPVSANRFIRQFSKVWNWGRIVGAVKGPNPVLQGFPFNAEKARKNHITPEQMPAFWKALDSEPNVYMRNLFKFVLFSGCRPDEARTMMWKDVDLDRALWIKPDTKTGDEQALPLTKYLVELLKATPVVTDNPYVFVGRVKGTHLAQLHHAWERLIERAKIDVNHRDSRRTFATFMRACGYEKDDVKVILNHGQVTDVTDRYALVRLERVREMMEVTTAQIQKAIKGKVKD